MSILDFVQKLFQAEVVQVYTDGSHKGKWGSWAFVIVKNGKIVFEKAERVRKTNSLRMEFQAAIEALTKLPKSSRVEIYTDSKILLGSRMDLDLQPQVNIDQTHALDRLSKDRDVSWNWVKAHSGNHFNERCDQLCDQVRSA